MVLILASASSIRRSMLEAADVSFRVEPSTVDESALKAELAGPREIAAGLAQAKALDVSRRWPEDWVIGSDSVVSIDGKLFDKPRDCSEAAEHLRQFSGRVMELTSAVALARGRSVDWTHEETCRLSVRQLSEAFIQSYLDKEWPEVGYCVGVFRMEGRGVSLFERVEGDYFSILGMPLIPLLNALRARGLLES